MADAMDTLKSLLGDDAEEKIQAVMSSLSASGSGSDNNLPVGAGGSSSAFGIDSVLKIKEIIDELGNTTNDSRAHLLYSLKPFMRTSRHSSIDSAIRLLSLTKLSSLFKK